MAAATLYISDSIFVRFLFSRFYQMEGVVHAWRRLQPGEIVQGAIFEGTFRQPVSSHEADQLL